jgi:hypothetical protein
LLSYAPPLLGSTTPRIYTPPLVTGPPGPPGPCGCGCALTPKTSLGFNAVDFATDVLGVPPLPWQRWLLIHAMELRRDGKFRYRTILVLVSRQNGKTTIVEVKNLWKMVVLHVALVIGTAQNLDIAEESWDKAVEIAESIPDIAQDIEHIDKTNGKKALKLAGKDEDGKPWASRWKIAAASRKGGRGLSGDDVNLDELREHHTWAAWAAVTKTTMARANAQVWAYSNAGDDKSVVLNDLQAQGRAAAENPGIGDQSLGLFEWSAPEDVKCTCHRKPHLDSCRLQDRAAWAQANPSLGYTITEEALAAALATDPTAVFRTECLCQKVEDLSEWGIFTKTDWVAAQDPGSELPGRPAFCIGVSQDLTTVTIGAAGPRDDGKRHLEVVARFPADTGRVVGWLKKRRELWNPMAVVVDPAGPAAYLIPDIEKHYGEVTKPAARDVSSACSSVYIGISATEEAARNVVIRPHPALDAAAQSAVWRQRGDAKAFDRRSDEAADAEPLVCVALADWAASTAPEEAEFWAFYE